MEQKNKFNVGDCIVAMKPDFSNLRVSVIDMYDADTNEKIKSCPHSKQKLKVRFSEKLEEFDILRSDDKFN